MTQYSSKYNYKRSVHVQHTFKRRSFNSTDPLRQRKRGIPNRQAMCVKPITEQLSRNYYCRRKKFSGTYSEFVSLALVIRQALRMCRNLLLSVACSVLPYFITLSHRRREFNKKIIEHKIYDWTFSKNFSTTFLV
jgi:hypothetical protein